MDRSWLVVTVLLALQAPEEVISYIPSWNINIYNGWSRNNNNNAFRSKSSQVYLQKSQDRVRCLSDMNLLTKNKNKNIMRLNMADEDEDEDEDYDDDDDDYRASSSSADDDIEVFEDDFDFDDEDDDDDDDDDSESKSLWKEKIAAKRAKAGKTKSVSTVTSREESSAKDYLKPQDPFTSWYLAVGYIDNDEMRSIREKLWTRHMQWVRRSALAYGYLSDTFMEMNTPDLFYTDYPAKVEWEFTLLSDDCMGPVGQVIAFRSNSSEYVQEYLNKEPLMRHGGISAWELLDMNVHDDVHEALSHDIRPSPYIFMGKFDKKTANDEIFQSSLNHHLDANRISEVDEDDIDLTKEARVSFFGQLGTFESATNENSHKISGNNKVKSCSHPIRSKGLITVFSAKSNEDAVNYIINDPILKAAAESAGKGKKGKKSHSQLLPNKLPGFESLMLSPVNLQDTTGLHHRVAQRFGHRTQLDKIHFMDPEDLLTGSFKDASMQLSLAEDETEDIANKIFLEKLEAHDISYRYMHRRIQYKDEHEEDDEEDLKDLDADDDSVKPVSEDDEGGESSLAKDGPETEEERLLREFYALDTPAAWNSIMESYQEYKKSVATPPDTIDIIDLEELN